MAEEDVVVTLTFSTRPDGGVRIHSDTLPGLVLSGADVTEVLRDLGPAIRGLLQSEERWPATPGVHIPATGNP